MIASAITTNDTKHQCKETIIEQNLSKTGNEFVIGTQVLGSKSNVYYADNQ